MSTLPDVIRPANTWVDVYAATGITPGTPIQIFNKSDVSLVVQETAVAPTAGTYDGPYVSKAWPWIATQQGVTGCWVKSTDMIFINVQVVV